MADGSKVDLAKLGKLFEALEDLQEKQGAIVKEIASLLGGGPGFGALLKQAERSFAAVWGERYRGAYLWRYAVDRPNLKRLIASLGIEELEIRMARYIRDEDAFLVRQRHPFGLFVRQVNQYASEGKPLADLELADDLEADATATRRRLEGSKA